jgi:hypothetical protein
MDKAKELFEAVQNGEFDFAFSEYSAMCEKAKSFVLTYQRIFLTVPVRNHNQSGECIISVPQLDDYNGSTIR